MNLRTYYRALLRRFGSQRWWPAESPFEVMVGAILTQNTNWSNVEKAIANLKSHDLLDPERLHAVDTATLALLIRPTGYFNVKAARLKTYVAWFWERYGGNVRRMAAQPMEQLREELLEIKGIGQETADSILLYALDMPIFVVDAYTNRIFSRHHLVPEESSYEEMQDYASG
ncbi:MAG: endonuclease, partial [Planctomycetes bacterium RBG_16_59_8]